MTRLASFVHQQKPGYGPVLDDSVIDLSSHAGFPETLKGFVRQGTEALSRLHQLNLSELNAIATDAIDWRLPINDPDKIIYLGLNYRDHAAEGDFEVAKHPTLFIRFPSSLTGHRQPLILTKQSHRFDYEAELAVIIGKPARYLTRETALSCVWGYSLFNDASIRDYQVRTTQWTPGKNFDQSGSFGPWIVPAEELPAGASGLAISTRLNGETVQSDNTENMIFDVRDALVEITESMALNPGDVIAMGTPAGCGFARSPRLWMKDGDEIEVSIYSIGTLQNKVQNES